MSTMDQIRGLFAACRLAAVDLDIGESAFSAFEAATWNAFAAALKIEDGCSTDGLRPAAAASCECKLERCDEFCVWCSSEAADCETCDGVECG